MLHYRAEARNCLLYCGDALTELAVLPDHSVHAMITDPPAGIAFMGKTWDMAPGGRAGWVAGMTAIYTETLRVLMPGAHALVWALPRTSHWTATALEDAGFEIRDVITHLFGTGFPKSLDVSKALDGVRGKQGTGFIVAGDDGRAAMFHKDLSKRADYGYRYSPTTDLAKQWEGWGTALKPASEHWILCRAPLAERTVAANVAAWGVGALNIDGARVEHDGRGVWGDHGQTPSNHVVSPGNGGITMGTEWHTPGSHRHNLGRWPANVIVSHNADCAEQCTDGCAVAMLDAQSGECPGATSNSNGATTTFSSKQRSATVPGYADTGGASRFFYCPKASTAERGYDNDHPTVKAVELMRYLVRMITPPNGVVLDPFAGTGSTGIAALRESMRFVGFEREAHYCELATKRLRREGQV